MSSESISDFITDFSGAGNLSISQRQKLSPVSEDERNDDFFEMVTPAVSPHRRGEKYVLPRRLSTAVHPKLARPPPAQSLPPSEQLFTKRQVMHTTEQPKTSALSQALASTSGSTSNPFSETYAAISGRGESASMNIPVFFPRARNPAGKPLNLNVRRDSTIEEVLGFALWTYWEEGWLPTLSEGVTDERDPKLSAVGWILRLAEDDGEVDDDFPGKLLAPFVCVVV